MLSSATRPNADIVSPPQPKDLLIKTLSTSAKGKRKSPNYYNERAENEGKVFVFALLLMAVITRRNKSESLKWIFRFEASKADRT